MRGTATLLLPLSLAFLHLTSAFDCLITASGITYDLRPLSGLRTASSRTDTPPTLSEARVRLDLCGDGIGREDGLSDEDQCPSDAKACLKLVNIKSSDERITSVIPVWTRELGDDAIWAGPLGKKGEDGVKIRVDGPDYAGSRQYLNLTLRCSESSHDPNPSFISYTSGTLSLEWSTPDACPRDGSYEGGEDGGGGVTYGGSSSWGFWGVIKFFFWLGVFGLLVYFVVGAFYNHQQYSARGWDLLPHRDFWREFPALVKDLFGHVFNGVRGGGSRGGYNTLG